MQKQSADIEISQAIEAIKTFARNGFDCYLKDVSNDFCTFKRDYRGDHGAWVDEIALVIAGAIDAALFSKNYYFHEKVFIEPLRQVCAQYQHERGFVWQSYGNVASQIVSFITDHLSARPTDPFCYKEASYSFLKKGEVRLGDTNRMLDTMSLNCIACDQFADEVAILKNEGAGTFSQELTERFVVFFKEHLFGSIAGTDANKTFLSTFLIYHTHQAAVSDMIRLLVFSSAAKEAQEWGRKILPSHSTMYSIHSADDGYYIETTCRYDWRDNSLTATRYQADRTDYAAWFQTGFQLKPKLNKQNSYTFDIICTYLDCVVNDGNSKTVNNKLRELKEKMLLMAAKLPNRTDTALIRFCENPSIESQPIKNVAIRFLEYEQVRENNPYVYNKFVSQIRQIIKFAIYRSERNLLDVMSDLTRPLTKLKDKYLEKSQKALANKKNCSLFSQIGLNFYPPEQPALDPLQTLMQQLIECCSRQSAPDMTQPVI